MKKYKVKKAFSLMERVLLIPEDEIYAEPVRQMIHVYSPKTRKLLGKVSSLEFSDNCKLFRPKNNSYGR